MQLLLVNLVVLAVLQFDINVVPDTKFAFNHRRGVQPNNATVGHDADAIGEDVSLFDVLGAHDDGPLRL